MERRESSQEIDRLAAHWVARIDRAPLSGHEAVEWREWLATDPRHRGAFMRAQAIWMRSESAHALGHQYDPADFQQAATVSAPPVRRRWMKWSGAVAASFIPLLILLAALPMPAAYATAKGEIRTVPLGNGTTITLNTDTRIKVYDDEGQRRIRVVRGEVLIESVAATAPTLVEVGDSHIEASAATFVVRKLQDQPAQVLVQDGRVVFAEAGRSAAIPLAAETGWSLPDEGESKLTQTPLSFPQLGRELAWREGKIALQGETLAEAAAIYERYSDTRIVISDPELAQMKVTGLFSASNPLGFSRAVAEVFDAEVRQERREIVISRPH